MVDRNGSNPALGGSSGDVGIAPPNYRLPADTRLGPISLQVSDLARSTEFYQQVLGLRALSGGSGTALLAPSGSSEPLLELVEQAGASAVPRRGRLGLFHVAYLLPDRTDLGRFLAHTARLQIPVGMSDHMVSEAIYLSDPDGLGIEVYADRPREAWRYASRQISMSTDPLDAMSLIEDTDGTHWDGAPAGTVVGHVHLHVGDLKLGARFYHEGIGFDKVVWNYPGALFMSAGGYHHHLGTNTWAAGADPPGENDAKLLYWTIRVPDAAHVEAVGQSLREAGFPAEMQDGALSALDPWGTRVRIRT